METRGAAMVGLAVALVMLGGFALAGVGSREDPGLQVAGWIETAPAVSPPAMAGAVMAYSEAADRFVLFGGWNGTELGETWTFDPHNRSWDQLATRGSPPARGDSAFAYDSREDVFVLFGGWYDSPPEVYRRFGDTWHFYLHNESWVQQFPSTSPSARSDSAFAYDSLHGGFVLFGGFDGSRYLGGTWRYDAHAGTWTDVTPSVEPAPRADGRMAYDSWRERFLIFGGNDFSGPNFTFHHLDDTWVYAWSDNSWTELVLPIHPSARDYAVFDFHRRTGEFLLHGGYGERIILGDLWAFNTTRTAWAELPAEAGPEPRFAAVGGYGSQEDVFLVFGGLGDSGLLADTWLFRHLPSGESSPPTSMLETLFLPVTAVAAATTIMAIVVAARVRRRRRIPSGRGGDLGDSQRADERPDPLASEEGRDAPPR